MKKRWLAAIMAMILAVSPVAAQSVDASQNNVIMADMMESQRDSLVGDEIDTASLETGETATSPYVDTDADPTKSYEYTIVGDDGSVAVVEVPALLNKVYTKYTFTEGTSVPNGTYVIVGARSGYSLNKAVVRTDTVIFDDYTKMLFESNVSISEGIITTDLTAGEWEVAYDSNNANYTFKVPGENKYLAIYAGNNVNGTVTSSASQNLQIVKNTQIGDGSVSIGGAYITGSSNGWINYREDATGGAAPGTWTSGASDAGSAWYLYQLKYKITDDAIATATASVGEDSAQYTADTWAAYQNALAATESVFSTADAATEKYDALTAAVNGLKKQEVSGNVTSVTYELVSISDNSYIEQGTYMLMLSRWHRAVLAEEVNGYKYIQVGTVVGERDYASETPDQTITLTKEQSEYAVEWELTKENGAFYLKNVKTQGYLQIGNGKGAVSAELTEDTKIATNIVAKSSYNGSEMHNGSVTIGQTVNNGTQYYLNMHSGYANGNTGGDSNGNDGGAAVYLYKKATINGSFTVDVTDLEETVADVANVTADDFSSTEKWNAFSAALTTAQNVLGERDTVFDTKEASDEYREEVVHAKNALIAAKNEVGYKVAAYKLVKKAADSTAIDTGVYMLVNARFYRALANVKNNNKLGYLQVIDGTFSAQQYNNGEDAPDYITMTEAIEAANLDWEISAGTETGKYYIKNVATGNYLTIVSEQAAASSSTGVDTVITGRTMYGSEKHDGSVTVGQVANNASQYLNMHGGFSGYFGGYDQDYDGGSAVYLYKKVPTGELYEADASALENLVDTYEAENLNSDDYSEDSWNAYQQELNDSQNELAESHVFETLQEALDDQDELKEAVVDLTTARENLRRTGTFSYTMEELYAEICKANGGQFLYSEECYEREAGLRYRAALKAARQTFATEDAAEEALAELIASVKNLQKNTIAESCFPVMTWSATVDRNRTVDNPDTADVDETTLPNYVARLDYLDTDGYDPDPDDPDNVTFERFEALPWEWSEIARLVNDEDERISPVWGQADNGMFSRRFSVRSSEETNDWQHANVYKIAGQFTWPEGYKLSETTIVLDSKNDFFYRDIYEYISENDLGDTFPLGQVLPINDDIYVVMWAETEGEIKPTVPNENDPDAKSINDYLAFWSGTSGKGVWTKNGSTQDDWGRDEPGTFIEWNLQGERAFYESFPNKIGTGAIKEDGTAYTNSDGVNLTSDVANYLDHTEQWYTLTDTSSINSVMRANYTDEEMKPGTIVHLDLYVMNNSGSGYLDELEIELFKQKATETTVTVNYYLDEVSEDGFLGSESLLNQEYGTKITLLPGTRAGQLNSYKKEAIYQANYNDVTDGVQVNELIVTEGGNNVVNVLYTEAAEKIVYLKAPSATHKYDGNDKTLNTVEVTVVENGVTQTAELVDSQYGTYKLPDGNFIRNVHSYVTEDLPGIYENNFTMENGVASSEPVVYEHDENGNIDLNTPLSNYRIVKVPGTLTITYEPAKFSGTYDFAGLNTYEDALNDVEKTARTKGYSSAEMYFTEDENTVSFRPSAVYNTAKEINVTLTFAGEYKVNKTYSFVPASNVLYGDNYMTVGETSAWTQVGEAVEWEITDNESTEDTAAVYGYSFDVFDEENSNATALKATLDINGETGIQGLTAKTDAMTFEFSGTGFDLISACGPDTGMLVVKLENKDTGKAKSYLVDTYFTGDDSIITSDGTSDVISYQVPVIREFGLDYANYKVTVYGYLINTAGAVTTYARGRAAVPTEDIVMTVLEELEMYDVEVEDVELSYIDENSVLNGGTGSVNASSGFGTFALRESTEGTASDTTANVYVDGFRVYQPMTTETAYVESEQGTKYYSLYDFVQTSINDLADATDNIALYVEYDGDTDTASIADYKIQGPQNELYLKSGNGIAFALAGYKEGDTVQVSAKAVTPGASLTEELSATEMYFDVPEDSIYYSDELGTYYAVVTNVETEDTNVMALCGLKVSDNITIFASGAMGEVVTEQVKEDNQEVFSPEKFNVKTAEKVRSGRNFTVSVETSTDATYVVVELADGTRHELTPTNTKAVASGIASVYKYSKAIKASNDFVVDGAIPVKVYAYTAKDGVASNPITVSVTVQ